MRKCLLTHTYILGLVIAAVVFNGCASSNKASRSAPLASHESKKKEIQDKYATILGVETVSISNYSLYSFIDEWYGAPYKYAGHSRDGVDCSDFVSILYQTVYNLNFSGTAGNMYDQCEKVSVSDIKEGDLVFFRINSKRISHIGIYLQNNKFVHASVHSGVVIDDLNENYYKKYFYKAGRLPKA